jgi:hypothetical protein
MLGKQIEGCALSKGDYISTKKNLYILSPLFGIFDFFVFFKFLTILKMNKRMLRYRGGMSVAGKKTSLRRMEHTHARCKETCVG